MPGYISPDSRSKILEGGDMGPAVVDPSAHASMSEEAFKTQICEDIQVCNSQVCIKSGAWLAEDHHHLIGL